MLKSEKRTQEMLISKPNTEKRARCAVEKKAHDAGLYMSSLQERNTVLKCSLNEKMDEMNGLIKQLAARNNKNARLKQIIDGKDNNTLPQRTTSASLEELESGLKQAEQQKINPKDETYGQHTESSKYPHGNQQNEDADTLDLNGEDVLDEKVVRIAQILRNRPNIKAVCKPRRHHTLDQTDVAQESEKLESRQNVIVLKPDFLPDDAIEIGADVTERIYWVKGCIRARCIIHKKYKDSQGNYYHVGLPEKSKNSMNCTSATESLIVEILTMHFYYNMSIGDIGEWLCSLGLNFSHASIMGWIEFAVNILAPIDKPLQNELLSDKNVHSDESTLKTCDRRFSEKEEREEDMEPKEHYFKRWIFCHHSPLHKLTQFVFCDRGRWSRKVE